MEDDRNLETEGAGSYENRVTFRFRNGAPWQVGIRLGTNPRLPASHESTLSLSMLSQLGLFSGSIDDYLDFADNLEDTEHEAMEDEEPDDPEQSPLQPAGSELLMSGDFGPVASKLRTRRTTFNTAMYLNDRVRPSVTTYKQDIASNLVPNTDGAIVASYSSSVYCGQFSSDASIYYTCCQDFRLHLYDMTEPQISESPRIARAQSHGHLTTMKPINSICGSLGQWTITDSHLSPDNERMIYSTLSSTVYMTNTREANPVQIPLHFDDPRSIESLRDGCEIWSCRFSADGKEAIAGGSGKIFVYDLLANRRAVKIHAHGDDVNSCCWADTASGNVLVSASDDTFIKVWDRRSLRGAAKPSGVLVGHVEGITCVSPKGDGRYLISNGKDQALKLWDLRKMCSSEAFETIKLESYQLPSFDYRVHAYPEHRRTSHPRDCSVTTYRGHKIARTLIRCYFSPAEMTGSQYIYSGSADGRIHIWSLDGQVVQILNNSKAVPMASGRAHRHRRDRHPPRVRDVSWSPQEPVLMSAASGDYSLPGLVARHEWKGLSKTTHQLEDWVEKQTSEAAERTRRPRGS